VMGKVIIDTSVWIESFKTCGDRSLHRLVKDLILSELVLLPGIIKTELLWGAKNKKE
jgi:predicted nucleic acid-binding protein